jgi:hypothetical protein
MAALTTGRTPAEAAQIDGELSEIRAWNTSVLLRNQPVHDDKEATE